MPRLSQAHRAKIGGIVACLFAIAFSIPVLATPLAAPPDSAAAATALRSATDGRAQISIHPATGAARFVRIPPGAMRAAAGASPAAQADAFLALYGALFGLAEPAHQLRHLATESDHLGATHLLYEQRHQGLPVFGGSLRIHVDATGGLTAVNGVIIPDLAVNPSPALSAASAATLAQQHVAAQLRAEGDRQSHTLTAIVEQLTILRANLLEGLPGADHLAYEVIVARAPDVRQHVFVDAHTGAIVEQFSGLHTAINRRVYKNSALLDPNWLVWQEGEALPYTDSDASAASNINRAIEYTGHVYNFFATLSGGEFLSWNGAGATMNTLYASPALRCPNATWNGQAVSFCVDAVSDDLVAHEWGHGYTQSTHQLVYRWQPGALNEAYSDIWGETIDLINGAGNDEPNTPRSSGACTTFTHLDGTDHSRRWLAFEDARGFGLAIRDLWNPNCFGHPGKVSDRNYFCSSSDDGGVHTNSGVPNHAFALLVDGGVYNEQTVRGIGLTRAANLYWRAQKVYHTRISDFADHADALEQACADLIDAPLYALNTASPTPAVAAETISADDCAQVSNAIAAVELRLPPSQCRFPTMLNPHAPPLCANEGPVQTLLQQDWESGLGSWQVGTRAVISPATFLTPDWAVVTDLPAPRTGSAAFVQNRDEPPGADQSGVLYLESPPIPIPSEALAPRLAFTHWFATEEGRDGGNVKVSVNGGPWTLLPATSFTFNPYNGSVPTHTGAERAFTGVNYSTFTEGSWGQSQVRLGDLAQGGDVVQVRFEKQLSAFGGVHGWYVDDVEAYYCQSCGNGQLNEGESCDDGNQRDGDGCSALCQVEPGWFCKDPVTPIGSQPGAPGICVDLGKALCSAPNAPIPDANPTGLSDALVIAASAPHPFAGSAWSPRQAVTDLDVYVQAEHTWLGDLSITLTHEPSGRQATLLDRPGSQTPGAFGCSGADMDVLFDDQSVLRAEYGCNSSAQPALRGNLIPHDGLSEGLGVFNGVSLAGGWRLTVIDHASDETGRLTRWCLVPTIEQGASPQHELFLPVVGK